MGEEIWYKDDGNYSCCWLAYFDLLGTRALIESESFFDVFMIYAKAIEVAQKGKNFCQQIVSPVWFSDTFLAYASDDSGRSFSFIDLFSRQFAYFLIEASIPVRGALSCGKFYADRSRSLYFGPALIEAFEYTEAQDWIGFLLSPSAENQLGSLGIPASQRLNYAYWNVPLKTGKKILTSKLPACILGQWLEINGRNLCLEKLYSLKRSVKPQYLRKYENAIKFIEKCQRRLGNKGRQLT
jgi:hypothetical protein